MAMKKTTISKVKPIRKEPASVLSPMSKGLKSSSKTPKAKTKTTKRKGY